MSVFNVSDYSMIRLINKGGFGEVFAASSNITGEKVAVKSCQNSKLIAFEIAILRLLHHDNILKLLEVQKINGLIHLILEFCDISDLSEVINRYEFLSEGCVQKIFRQLGAAVGCLRAHNVVHMDIKPENILLHSAPGQEQFVVKLADFGLSQILLPGETGSKNSGTLLYSAPEVHLHEPYDASVDLWSLGIVMYECLFGLRPFSSYERIIEYSENPWPIRIPTSNRISDICKNILYGLLKADPKERISFHSFINHEFLRPSNMNADNYRTNHHEDVRAFSNFLSAMFDSTDSFKITFKERVGMRLSLMGLQVSSLDPNCSGFEGEKKIVNDMLTALSYKPEEMIIINQMLLVFPTLRSSYQGMLGILLLTREEFDEALQFAKRAENLANVNMYGPAIQLYEYALNIMFQCVKGEKSGITRSFMQEEVKKWNQKYQGVKYMLVSKPC